MFWLVQEFREGHSRAPALPSQAISLYIGGNDIERLHGPGLIENKARRSLLRANNR